MRFSLFGAAGAVALLACSSAQAQGDDEGATVEELVVTGEKAERSLQDTPTSVAVISAKRIEEEKIQTFFEVVNRTANVSQTYGPSGFTIRGISNTNVSGGGNSGLATVYVDGAPVPERHLNGAPLDLWDVSQVEILRGPQSTLQGRNALAGAVVIRTQDPTFTWTAKARVFLSDENEQAFAAAGGGPIVADQLAFRLAVEDRHAEGFVYNTTRKADESPMDSTTIRGKLLITPSALPDLRIRAGWTHDERTGGYIFSYSRTDVPDFFDNRISTGDSPNATDSTSDIVTVQADYSLSDRLELTSVSSLTRVDTFSAYDGDDGPETLAFGEQDEQDQTFTQELRLSYQGERLTGLIGAYYANRERDYETTTLTEVPTPVDTLVGVLMSPLFGLDPATAQFAATTYGAALPVIPVAYTGITPEEITTWAVFGDGRFQLTPQISLLAGFRYDREKNRMANDQATVFAGDYPDPALHGPLAPVIGGLNMVVGGFVAQANAATPFTARTFDAFLPKVGLKYDFTDDLNASVVVQRGYRSGGTTINVARSTVVPYDQEYTWNYEASLRSTWFDDTLTLNANAYYVKWRDQQVNVNLGLNLYDYQTENAGRSHLYGFEIEGQYRPNRHLDAYASLGRTKTKFDDFKIEEGSTDIILTGSEFSFAPDWTWSVGGTYRWDNGFTANLNANYRGDAFSDVGITQADYAIDARIVVNGQLSYAWDDWQVSVFANNLFNEEYIQYNQFTTNRAMLGEPRVVGVILEASW
ncbi:MAG: TonB-dependent receptor [Caulobacteraceae bacterium]|nr:TonB-dependent receptor [Caulobacteraceae bacterium]